MTDASKIFPTTDQDLGQTADQVRQTIIYATITKSSEIRPESVLVSKIWTVSRKQIQKIQIL